MGKRIKVLSFDEMEAASKRLLESSETYSQISGELLHEAETMGEAWEGADNQAFIEQLTGLANDLKAMAQRLMDVSSALRQQKMNYMNRQTANMTAARQL